MIRSDMIGYCGFGYHLPGHLILEKLQPQILISVTMDNQLKGDGGAS